MFDAKNAPAGDYTLEETWAGSERQRIAWSGPNGFSRIEVVNDDGTFLGGGGGDLPRLLGIALKAIVHPLPTDKELNESTLATLAQSFGKTQLNCVMLTQPILSTTGIPLGLFHLLLRGG